MPTRRARTRRPDFVAGFLATLLGALLSPVSVYAAEDSALWSALRQGTAVALIRHALAPGYSDPDNFRLGDCTTQRNLSREGRQQAKSIGALFRRNGIVDAEVFTSQWCRCRDTADLLEIGRVEDLPSLNSFFENRERRGPQTEELRAWLTAKVNRKPVVLVTHQVNISALAGQPTSSGEIVFVKLPITRTPTVLGAIETQ